MLVSPKKRLRLGRIRKIVGEIASLKKKNYEVIIVTSGAIGMGSSRLHLNEKSSSMPQKQAIAAIGQNLLMSVYEKLFRRYGSIVAQVLLTAEDLRDRKRYLNVRNTLFTLLNYKVIPIVNENDTVAVEEIQFGDNDTLSALIASKVEADLLIVLSDIKGLYTADPRKDKKAKLIRVVEEITPWMESVAGKAGTLRGTGGMWTKIQAAKVATGSGVTMIVADGNRDRVITSLMEGEDVGTKFLPRKTKLSSRKRWIAFNLPLSGRIFVDEGAKRALIEKGKSLLPSGIVKVEGGFEIGDGVRIVDSQGKEFGRGLVYYSSSEVERIAGKKTKDIQQILGHKDYDEVIHRDNLVIL
ncbi:Glutamate 5-kinase [subsurface metagenome]